MSLFYGKIAESDKANEDWVSYVERMTLCFEANRIDEVMKKRLFCYRVSDHRHTSYWKVYHYQVNQQFQELVQMMKDHQDPEPNSIAKRFKFSHCDKKPGVNSRIHCRAEMIDWTL